MQKTQGTRRPPVVVVMGHVDHGKTTLLDYIRKTNVARREAGGITQSIGAYEITHNGQQMTFIDTPGHEAFSNMRSRGAKVADIAILVVAVDDSVQPQTKEAVKIIEAAKIPYVVAINKVDKDGTQIEKVKNELTAAGVLLEGYGGSVSFQPISAKTGQGIPELLDLISLTAEVSDLTAHKEVLGTGVILETRLDSRRGIVASAIVKDGTLKQGAYVRAADATGKAKGLEDFSGKRITEAGPSTPVLILGFDVLPQIGDIFESSDKPFEAKTLEVKKKEEVINKEGEHVLRLMLKADVSGSLEALEQLIQALPRPDGITIQIMDKGIGDISDGDVKFATSYGALILGFKCSVAKAAATLAEAQQVKIITSEVVYDLVKLIEEEFKKLDQGIVKGDLEILAVFGKKGSSQIVGGKVVFGALQNQGTIGISRRESVLGVGKIVNLQSGKKDVATLALGLEGGLLIDSEVQIRVGDHLIVR